MSTVKHGLSRYSNHGCRCDVCTTAQRESIRARRRLYRSQRELINGRWVSPTVPVHGTDNGYTNYGCRCEDCVKKHRETRNKQRMRK